MRTAQPAVRCRALLFAGMLLPSVGVAESPAQGLLTRWEVSEFQPDIPNGGRANTFTVHPADANRVYVTSESGGLFRSADRGLTWRHVDALPCFRTLSVAYLPANPNVVLVTTSDDFRAASGGGIWRSIDGGLTWAHVPVTIPPAITDGRLSGYEISVAPDTGDIYVGSTYGVLKSTDQGATWSYQDTFGGGNRNVFSVVALSAGRVIAGGPAGVRRSDTGGTTWSSPAGGPGAIRSIHALGRSPVSNEQAFAVNWGTSLFHTEDAGQTWTQIASAPAGGGGCGGNAFARAANRSTRVGRRLIRRLDLFFSNQCTASRLRVTRNATTGVWDYSGAWQALAADHADTRDIAFDNAVNAVPILLGTDGGIHKTADGGSTWAFAGGGRNGYNALQVTEVRGQLVQDAGRFDLYFGTQDNDLWSSGTYGATWTKGMCCEGFFIEAEKKVATAADSRITNVACAGCDDFVSSPLFTGLGLWPDPPGNLVGNPMIVKRSQHLQGVDASGGLALGLAVTNDLGASWQQYASFAEDRRDLPKLGRVGGILPRRSTVVYQAYRQAGWSPAGFEINHLLRTSKSRLGATASVFYPAMSNFGGLGINPTMFAWYQVYAVDPGNHLHVIAPDVVNRRMMETRDGGENWTDMPALTNLVTDGGRLLFNSSIFPIVSALSFSPQNPSIVAAGTVEGGLYLSTDNAATWFRVPSSEGITYTTAFAWRSAGEAIISTYGRGLWRLRSVLRIPRPDWERWCRPPCIIRIWPWEQVFDPIAPVEFDRGILVYDGRVLGAKIVDRVVQEVYVSEGSSVVLAGEDGQARDVKVVHTSKPVDFRGAPYRPVAPREASLMRGLVFDKANRLKGAVFGDTPMSLASEDERDDKEGNTRSPTEGKPYLRIATSRHEGGPVAAPGEVFVVTIANVKADSDLVLYVDDQPAAKGRATRDGSLKLEVRAPVEFGLHRITLRRGDDERTVVDGTMLLVKHSDEFRKEKPKPR